VNNYILPGVYIEEGVQEKRIDLNTFSTLFLSFEIDAEDIEGTQKIIHLQSLSDISRYESLKEELFITKTIYIYFENGGKNLYLMPQPSSREVLLDSEHYQQFLENRIDSLIDIETILAIDIFDEDIIKLTDKEKQKIQNRISRYCKKTNRLSLMDLPFDKSPLDYSKEMDSTIVFYPWMVDKKAELVPPSIYASSLLSKLASEKKVFHSLANIKIKSAIDSNLIVNRDYASKLYSNDINPIIYVQNDGYKIWGIKTLSDDIYDINTLRVFFLIKRALYLISKEYIFEPHNHILEEKIVRKVKNFLFELWKSGALKGASEEEAFIIKVNNSPELSISIAISIAKPLEFIVIHLNRTTSSDLQSTLNIS